MSDVRNIVSTGLNSEPQNFDPPPAPPSRAPPVMSRPNIIKKMLPRYRACVSKIVSHAGISSSSCFRENAEVPQQMKTRPHAKYHAESTIFSSLFVVEIFRCCRSAGCWLHCKIYPLQHADLPHQRFGSTAGRQYSEVCRTPRELDSRVRNMGEGSGVVEERGALAIF